MLSYRKVHGAVQVEEAGDIESVPARFSQGFMTRNLYSESEASLGRTSDLGPDLVDDATGQVSEKAATGDDTKSYLVTCEEIEHTS